uniref:MscS Mechanosensitive ion channel n=1 Tax=Cyanothece sp. (strain PCC 7425 / ATCC 29141) TaxID=395961 RepID=B8HU04_CYAP4
MPINIDRVMNASLKVGNQQITPLWILQLALTLILIILISQLFKRFLKNRLLVRFKISQGNREIISTLCSYSLGALACLLVLQVSGLDLTTVAVTFGALSVGIGFGLQELTKNLVSGLVLLFEAKLQVGDLVEFDGLVGYIKEISIRSTVIRTFDGGDVVVPNSNLTGNQVLNWSYKNFMGKIRLPISVAYDSDPVVVTETLLNSAYMNSSVLHDPPPKVIFKGFGENALEFELWAWIKRIDEGITVKSSLNFIIDYNFRRQGISIPFPQRDLWIRNPQVLQSDPDPAGENSSSSLAAVMSAPAVSLRHLLQQVPYFQTCSDLQMLEIIEAGYRKVLAESEILFKEGDVAESMYVVLSGKIETASCQLKQRIRTYAAGELFGEAPLLLGVPYLVTARAVEKTSLFVIPKANLERLLQSRPYLASAIADELMKERDFYTPLREQLEELGLLAQNGSNQGFINWVQTRLKSLFNI